jgi:hypothetical protein
MYIIIKIKFVQATRKAVSCLILTFIIIALSYRSSKSDILFLEFQGINDFAGNEDKYFIQVPPLQLTPDDPYLEVKYTGSSGDPYSCSSKCSWTFCMLKTNCDSPLYVEPQTFSSHVRATLTLNHIKEILQKYGGIFRTEIPPYIIKEFFPEGFTILKQKPEKAYVDVKLWLLSIIPEKGRDEKCSFDYLAKAEMQVQIGIAMGKTFNIWTRFQVPITVDILSWLPDVRKIEGEMSLYRGTMVINFGVCDTKVENEINYEDISGLAKVSRDEFYGRIKKLTSYIIYLYLGNIDYKPISFPILSFFSVKIVKAYQSKLITSGNTEGEDSISLEFDEKPADVKSPSLYFLKTPAKIINSERVELEISANDSETNEISFRVDNGVWSSWIKKNEKGTFSISITNLVQGKHEIQVIGKNIYGNINETSLKTRFLVDREPPDSQVEVKKYWKNLKVNIKAEDLSQDRSVEEFLSTDNYLTANIVLKQNGKEVLKIEKKFKKEAEIIQDVSEGIYKAYIWINDLGGNSTDIKEEEIIIDKTPPKIVKVFSPPPKTRYENLKVVVQMKDNFFSFGYLEYFVEEIVSEMRKTCFSQWGKTISIEINEPFGEGRIYGVENGKKYHLCFRVRDPADNTSEIFEEEFQVDLDPPKIKIAEFPQRVTFEPSGKILLQAEDDSSPPEKIKIFWTFSRESQIQNIIRNGGNLLISFSNLPDGRYSFSAYAMDEAGNTSKYFESEFIVDTTLKRLGGGAGTVLSCKTFDINAYSLIPFFVAFLFFIQRAKKKKKNS